MSFRIGRKHAVHSYPEPLKAGPAGPPGPAGGMQVIRYQVGPGPGTYDSVTALPSGAVVVASSFDNDPADDASNVLFVPGTTATVGTPTSATLFQDATENAPDSEGNYENLLNLPITPATAGVVRTVIVSPGETGVAHVMVVYIAVPQP